MKTHKICKRGTGKASGFEGCGEELSVSMYNHPNFKYGLGISCGCYKEWLITTEAGGEVLNKARIQGKKRADKEQKKEGIRRKEESKSIAQLIQETRRPFQKLIRIRDHGQNCICCDRPLPFNIGDFDAGHMYSREQYSGLIFHPDNCHGQTKFCNRHNHGNESGYLDCVSRRIGKGKLQNLQNIKNELKSYKWSREELNKLKKYYNSELKLVESGVKKIEDVDLSIGIINR
jgi:hypothetical protein